MSDAPSAAGEQLGAPAGGQGADDKMIHVPVSLLPEGCKEGDTYKIVSKDDDVASMEPVGKSGSGEMESDEDLASGARDAVYGAGQGGGPGMQS